MTTICKELVRSRFGQSAATYHHLAHIQQSIAIQLAERTINYAPLHKILEIGCGTGFLTKDMMAIHQPHTYYLNDLSPSMIGQAALLLNAENCRSVVLPGDAETISFPGELDAIVSSSAIQWFQQPALFLKKASEALHCKGVLAIATYGEKNFIEIKSLSNQGLYYPEADQLKAMITPWFDLQIFEQQTVIQWFDSVSAVLNHMKQTGVNCLAQNPMSAGNLRRLMDEYSKQYANRDGQIPLTWHPIIVVATKKQ